MLLKTLNLQKSFGKTHVLKGISLEVKEGEVIAIIGPSGSGKSTLLRCLTQLERVDKGTIEVDGIQMVGMNGEKAVYADNKILHEIIP